MSRTGEWGMDCRDKLDDALERINMALTSREDFDAESLRKDTLIAMEMGKTLGLPAFKDLKWLTGEESTDT